MILLSLLNAFVSKEIAGTRHGERLARDSDPSEWRLRDLGDVRIDDRSSCDPTDSDRSRPEFPTI